VQSSLGTPGWEEFEELEEILSCLHGWVPPEAARHVPWTLGKQEGGGGTAAEQILGEAHTGGCVLTVVTEKSETYSVRAV